MFLSFSPHGTFWGIGLNYKETIQSLDIQTKSAFLITYQSNYICKLWRWIENIPACQYVIIWMGLSSNWTDSSTS